MKKLTGRVATSAKPKITAPELPAISASRLQTVEGFLLGLRNSDGQPVVDREQADVLAGLEFSNGEKILSLDTTWFIYEISWILQQLGYDATVKYLSVDWMKTFGEHNIRKKMLFENPLLESSKEKMLADMTIYQNQADAEMGEPCKRCGSENTVSIGKQTRSADEAETIKVHCGSCGYKWIAQ